jgi:hypothetical protein
MRLLRSASEDDMVAGEAGDVFTGMPADVTWHRAALTPAELATVRYIDYPYWTGLSGGTRLAADGARRLGPWQNQPPGTIYRQIAENPRDGRLPPPIILLSEPGLANLIVIEGHKRPTGLLLDPRWLPAELDVMLGITSVEDGATTVVNRSITKALDVMAGAGGMPKTAATIPDITTIRVFGD